MANTQLLKRRIKTAQNVSKTTRAMQMIAASKMKRAQEATFATRPYVQKLTAVSQSVAAKITENEKHPYMKEKNTAKKTLLIVISPDKGLCGGLVTNLVREYLKLPIEQYYVVGIGKKIEKYVVKLGENLVATFHFGTTLPTFDKVYPLAKIIDEYFLSGKVDKVEVLGVHFDSIFTQKPRLTQLLPLTIQQTEEENKSAQTFQLFEPNVKELLPTLLSHYMEMTMYQHLLESFVSEQGARMIAMQNATDNAKDIIQALTLEYNKARQERITNEILDISSAANYSYA